MAYIKNGKLIWGSLRDTRKELALKSGMCEPACEHAIEDRCKCYCEGQNHGIKVQGRLYDGESIRDLQDMARFEEAA